MTPASPAAAARSPGDGAIGAEALPRAIGNGAPLDRLSLLEVRLRSIPRPRLLAAPLTALRGAGPRLAEAAAELGIATVGDLLLHVPHRHLDLGAVRPIAELGISEREVAVRGVVRSIRARPTRNRRLRLVEATVSDSSGPLKVLWFNQPWLVEKLPPGTEVLLRGKLDRDTFRATAHEVVGGRGDAGFHTTGLVPVHPAAERLRADRIRDWAWQALPAASQALEPLPSELRVRRRLPGVADALAAIHFPRDRAEAELARSRLAYEELFCHQVALALRRSRADSTRPGVALAPGDGLAWRWLASLPFEATADQRRAIAEVDADLRLARPMRRLLMGEVGSGKTVVAVFAMLRAVEAGMQAALMAPTETLAEQHAATLDQLLAGERVPFALLTSATPAARRREALGRLASGELPLVVGTHALLEADIEPARLAVCVVDEQHRFGVRQRAELDAKGPPSGPGGVRAAPHALHMTATPIPRTLSLTAYGDLDTTVLRELPAGRRPVRTWAVGEDKRGGAYAFIRDRLREGRQAYVVCPLVTGSEKLEAKAAADEAKRLSAGELREFRVELLHGQMSSAAKAEAMGAFARGEADVLVATSVIEVGIDVPNATVMLIEGAERYGLSQLHQLRGRVGRGPHESHCILFADPESELARRRIEAIATERDGFKLAEVDLALRGEGEILGTRQHGLPSFRVASLPDDTALLLEARRDVRELLGRHGRFDAPALGPLLDAARLRFGDERVEGVPA